MKPGLTKLNFTTHLTTAVAWLGAVASFLALSIAGVTSRDPETVRGAYLAMNLIGKFIIVPLSLAALITGLVQSLGTQWGLFRHYWVVVKFVLTIGATILLLLHQFTAVATAARRVFEVAAGTLPDVGPVGTQLVGDAGLAVMALVAIAVLGIYKPWGPTRYGRRKQQHRTPADANDFEESSSDSLPLSLRIFIAVAGLLVLGFALLHHGGAGSHAH